MHHTLDIPTRKWVPRWFGILAVFVVILPVTLLNGAYTGSMIEISNTLGIMSEDITLCYYATSAGMAVVYPVVYKIIAAIPQKTLLLADLILQVLLSLLCAKSGSIGIILTASFLIGMLKAFLMAWFISHIKFFFSPRNIRSEVYAYFYPIVFSGGQLSMALTAQLAYYYDWTHMYYFMMLLLLTGIVFVLVCFRYVPKTISIPFQQINFKSMLVAGCFLLMSIYLFTYGRTLDWFASPRLRFFMMAIPVLAGGFLWEQSRSETPLASIKVLQNRKTRIAQLFMMFVMFLSSSSTLVSSYLNRILQVDSVRTNTLSLWLIPGFALGAFFCFWWFRLQPWRLRYLIAAGFLCFAVYMAFLYFGISPESTYSMLFFPTFLRGTAMMVLLISFGIYGVESLDPKLLMSNSFFLISSRSVLAPSIALSFYNNAMYRLQNVFYTKLSGNLGAADSLAEARYSQSMQQSLASGHGFDEALAMASTSLNNTLNQQSLLLAIKYIFGILLIASLVVGIACIFIPFRKTVKVKPMKGGNDMV